MIGHSNKSDSPSSATRRQIDLKEWESSQVSLDASEIVDLLRWPANILKVQMLAGGICKIQPAGVVGRLRLGAVDLRITPKYPMPSLLAMLAEVHELARLDHLPVGYEKSPDIADLLIQIFLHQADWVVRKGLKRTYIQEDEELVAGRGRIDLRRTVGHHARGRAVLQCRFEDHSLDGPENRLLMSALLTVASCTGLSVPRRNLAQQIASEFVGVRGCKQASSDSGKFKPDRLTSHYFPALPLARLVLQGIGITHKFGIVEGDGFLLNMNQLFESFVGRRLKKTLSFDRVQVFPQQTFPFDADRQAELRPDLVVQSPLGQRIVVDTKYKIGSVPEPSDLYQMLAYCRILNVTHGVLVTVGTGYPMRYNVLDGVTTIEVIPVDLNGTISKIDKSLKCLSDRILEILAITSDC